MELDKIYNEDCLEGMKRIPDGSIDCIICDLPYGVLNKSNKTSQWDNKIPLEPLWNQYWRIAKRNAAVVLFSQGMFTARKMHENLGRWPKLSEKSDYQIYFKEAEWISKMFDLASDDEIKLIKKYGVFNCYKNTKGCVRDHKYSRRSGFKNRVFPQLLRHPCNCQIILHGNNVKKSFKVNQTTNTTDDVISLNDLFIAIENYAFEWVEQDLCMDLIKQYREGERWVNPYKLPTS